MVGPEGYGEDVIHDIRTDRRSAERGGADRTVVHRPVARCLAVVGVTVLALVATACASSSSSGSTTSSTGVVARSVVGRRYCEVLLVHLGPSGVYADVYNSYPLNACPEAEWSALDPSALARQDGASAALLNGPRYWLMDSIDKVRSGAVVIRRFGDIAMMLDATVTLGTSVAAAMQPYTPHTVDRQASFTFDAGRQVYELVAPDGTVWVMQTLSQVKDPTLTRADLPGLASRLRLPAGWTYRTRTLSAPLVVATADHPAQVLQDTLSNSYSQETGG